MMKPYGVAMAAMTMVAVITSSVAAQQNQQGQQGATSSLDADRQFVQESIRTNLFEVAVGKDVANRTENQEVKEFAQTMVDYHSKANENLRQVAQQIGIEAPSSMNQWQQAMVKHMQGLKTQELDRKYMFHQAGAHHIKLLNHRFAILQASKQQVKQLAQRMYPTLQEHKQKADRISEQIASGPASGGTGSAERR